MKDLSNENIIHIKKEGIEYIQFKKLLEYKNIIHCFTLKPMDFASNDTYEEKKESVSNNFEILSKELNFDINNIYRPRQTHTNVVDIVEDGYEGIFNDRYNNVDGLTTNKKNKVLILGFADCTPLFFYDPVKNVIANTHSGWKGTLQEISVRTIEKMQQEYKCKPENIICCIGPHIRKCHFEVEKDIKDTFFEKFKHLKNINDIITFDDKKQKYFIDTLEINKQILIKIGLKEENIIDSKICTVCHSNICHSYRAEKDTSGRAISIIEIK